MTLAGEGDRRLGDVESGHGVAQGGDVLGVPPVAAADDQRPATVPARQLELPQVDAGVRHVPRHGGMPVAGLGVEPLEPAGRIPGRQRLRRKPPGVRGARISGSAINPSHASRIHRSAPPRHPGRSPVRGLRVRGEADQAGPRVRAEADRVGRAARAATPSAPRRKPISAGRRGATPGGPDGARHRRECRCTDARRGDPSRAAAPAPGTRCRGSPVAPRSGRSPAP